MQNNGTTAWTIVFVLAGFGLVGLGLTKLTIATLGVGLIALGIFAAVFARIVQAGAAHAKVVQLLREQAAPPKAGE